MLNIKVSCIKNRFLDNIGQSYKGVKNQRIENLVR